MVLLLVFALIGSLVVPLVARVVGRGAGLIVALFPIALLAGFVRMADTVERGWVRGEGVNWATSMGADLTFRLDGFSFLFCLLVTAIGSLVIIYSGAYLTGKPRAERTRFFTLILLFMTAMLGAVLAENLLVLATFWEATSILSFLLVGFDNRSARSRRAALMALQVTAGGGLALLAAVLMIGEAIGTFSMAEAVSRASEIAAHPLGPAIIICLMLAAFTKSAQVPFHFWLPNAMQAPTPASAYLHSATMVKLGVYLLARFEPVVAAVPWGRTTIIVVACVTMLVASIQALRAENFKSALAYSTMASLGILMLLVGLDGPQATVAMIGFLFSHAIYKAALFFCAGSVLHATGSQSLRSLGGLYRFLPYTALATIGASLSMAGIPPFLGFISKEFLFQAQIESSWDVTPLAIAVLVNAVMVGVAAVVTLRPFFLGHGKVTAVKHRETPSLVVPPLLLALAGLTISLNPDWITRVALRPAVAAVYGRAVEVEIEVWHGITPMLLLSIAVVSIGALIARYWKVIHIRLNGLEKFETHTLERRWDMLQAGGTRFARAVGRWLQNGQLPDYLLACLVGASVLMAGGLWAAGVEIRLPAETPWRWDAAAVAVIGLGGAIAATRAKTLVAAMIAVGLTGFAAAIGFLLNGAPDLALTQFTVEALLVVLLTALLLAVPLATPPTRSRERGWIDSSVVIIFSALLLAAAVDMAGADPVRRASDFFGEASYAAAKGLNVVNVILVDFRGFDTLGETVVIGLAALLGRSLLGRRGRLDIAPERRREQHMILSLTAKPFAILLGVVAIFLLLRGHDQPGGGFVGGLVAALAFAVLSLSEGPTATERTLRVPPMGLVGIGLLLCFGSGLAGMAGGAPFLTHLWWEPNVAGFQLKLSTTLLFDLGVLLVVVGAVLSFLFGLQREAAR